MTSKANWPVTVWPAMQTHRPETQGILTFLFPECHVTKPCSFYHLTISQICSPGILRLEITRWTSHTCDWVTTACVFWIQDQVVQNLTGIHTCLSQELKFILLEGVVWWARPCNLDLGLWLFTHQPVIEYSRLAVALWWSRSDDSPLISFTLGWSKLYWIRKHHAWGNVKYY